MSDSEAIPPAIRNRQSAVRNSLGAGRDDEPHSVVSTENLPPTARVDLTRVAADEIAPPPTRAFSMKPRTLALLLGALAAAVKLYCAATTAGSVDIDTFHKFAKYVAHSGLAEGYRNLRAFNHPPVTAWIIKCTMRLARKSAEPGRFGLYFRGYSIIADFISLVAVLWLKEKTGRPAWRAIWLFALSPVHFAISGFHGNTDPILSMFIFLAAIACMGGRPIATGILYGLACNLKIAPVIFFPPSFSSPVDATEPEIFRLRRWS